MGLKNTNIKNIASYKEHFRDLAPQFQQDKVIVLGTFPLYWANRGHREPYQSVFDLLPEHLKKDEDVIWAVLDSDTTFSFIHTLDKKYITKRENMLRLAYCNIGYLALAPKAFTQDAVFMKEVLHKPEGRSKVELALTYASDELRSNKDFVRPLVEQNVRIFPTIAESLKQDEAFIWALVAKKGAVYSKLSNQLKADEALARFTLKHTPSMLQYVPKTLREQPAFMLYALQHNGFNEKYIPPKLKKNAGFMAEVEAKQIEAAEAAAQPESTSSSSSSSSSQIGFFSGQSSEQAVPAGLPDSLADYAFDFSAGF